MTWLASLLAIIKSIMDRLPSRMESLKNQRDIYKQELHDLQYKKPFDSNKYDSVAEQLYRLEARISNAGG